LRDTYLEPGALAAHARCARAAAERTVELFRERDEKLLGQQLAIRDDEQRLTQTAALAARELERMLRTDEVHRAEPD
jgi:hypothetical protein